MIDVYGLPSVLVARMFTYHILLDWMSLYDIPFRVRAAMYPFVFARAQKFRSHNFRNWGLSRSRRGALRIFVCLRSLGA